MDFYQGKYRTDSQRLTDYDYRQCGAYFITILTKHRAHYFGDVKDSQMQFTPIGQFAHDFWMEIPDHFAHVALGNFIVMPNHTHGILIVKNEPRTNSKVKESKMGTEGPLHHKISELGKIDLTENNVSTHNDELRMKSPEESNTVSSKATEMAHISPKSGSISTIIRSYKSVVSKHARKIDPEFHWQARFHDHIIRDKRAFENIQNYIANNPRKWALDKTIKTKA